MKTRIEHLFFVLMLLIIAGHAEAQELEKDVSSKRGFYMGAESGLASLQLDGSYLDYHAAHHEVKDKEVFIDRSYQKVFSGLNLGYISYRKKRFFALETDLSFYHQKVADRFYTGGYEHDLSTGYGFDISNKLKFNITGLAGIRVGQKNWIHGQVGLTHTDIYLAAGHMPFHTDISGASLNWKGATFGLGYTRSIYDQVMVRFKYNFTTYFYGNNYDGRNLDGEEYHYAMQDQRISVGLIYELNVK